MTALTKQQGEATRKLHAKYDSDPKPVNSSASIGGGQMTINVGMERISQLDIRKSNNAAMAITDFFTARIYLTGLLSQVGFDT